MSAGAAQAAGELDPVLAGLPPRRGLGSRLVAVVRGHRALAALLVLAAAIRVAVLVTYPSGLFFPDSWAYMDLAWRRFPFDLAPDRPSGYALVIRLFAVGHHVLPLLIVQHIAGLAVAAIAYIVLTSLGVRRWWAVVVAAIVAFDGYAIALQQFVMSEPTFTLLAISALALAVMCRGTWVLALSGLLAAAACLVRTEGLVLIPLLLLYALWRQRGAKAVIAMTVAMLLPLAGYAAVVHVKYHRFTLTAADGWFLYGRVGPFATCRGVNVPADQRFLCTDSFQRPNRSASSYVYDPDSPINRHYGTHGPFMATSKLVESSTRARRFALRIIRAHPGAYADAVAASFFRYFAPGTGSFDPDSDVALKLPARRPPPPPPDEAAVQRRVQPRYKPSAGALAPALHRYQAIVHTPRWLLAIAALLSLAALATAPVRRRRARSSSPEIALFSGAAVGMFLLSALGAEFILRYSVPAEPLLLIGGALTLRDLLPRGAEHPVRRHRPARPWTTREPVPAERPAEEG